MRVRMAASAPPMVMAGSTRLANDAGAGDGQPSQLDGEEQNQDRAQREVGERQAEEADDAEQAVVPAIAALGGAHSRGDGEDDRDEQRRQRELQRVGIALGDEARDGLVVAKGAAEIAVQNAFPVMQVLLAERSVEAVGVARGLDVGGRRAFAEHLRDGISGDQVDEQEDEANHQPDDWEGVEDALEERRFSSRFSVLRFSARVGRTPRYCRRRQRLDRDPSTARDDTSS